MPIEIKELVIRAVVEKDSARSEGSPGAASTRGGVSADERADIIEAAVREVMRILRAAKER